jgi:seryl-tRNA synthetase
MHDPQHLIDLGAVAREQLGRRGYQLDLAALADLVRRRGELTYHVGKLRAEANRLARQPPGQEAGAARARARDQRDEIKAAEAEHRQASAALTDMLLTIPNLPDERIPDGYSGQDAVEVSRSGQIRELGFTPRHHAELGEQLGILDSRRAAKLSGARFSVTRGAGAALERALGNFFLDLHVGEHRYLEHSVPSLVTRQAMTGTGQLPKFEFDLFATSVAGRELFLIPTAEVPLTNLHAGETIDAARLPVALTAWTPCFRGEAGSYGRDTRGILRLHEFSKVELVRICAPADVDRELATLVEHAETCLRRLGLDYRVVLLAAGDTGFAARRTYDIEVWLPSQQAYQEISSCSDCGTFQARRAGIWMRSAGGRKELVATLNGSALPIGRTLVAILEQYQQADGGVAVPAALVPYTGFSAIRPDGTTCS